MKEILQNAIRLAVEAQDMDLRCLKGTAQKDTARMSKYCRAYFELKGVRYG